MADVVSHWFGFPNSAAIQGIETASAVASDISARHTSLARVNAFRTLGDQFAFHQLLNTSTCMIGNRPVLAYHSFSAEIEKRSDDFRMVWTEAGRFMS